MLSVAFTPVLGAFKALFCDSISEFENSSKPLVRNLNRWKSLGALLKNEFIIQ
jgi:hypothetical protein